MAINATDPKRTGRSSTGIRLVTYSCLIVTVFGWLLVIPISILRQIRSRVKMSEVLMPPKFPSPEELHPVPLPDGSKHLGTVFLKSALKNPRIEVGDYSYASAHSEPEDWDAYLAPYLYENSPERLIIGKFCQFANDVLFVTSSANHRYDGFSSYPFFVFDGYSNPAQGRPSEPRGHKDTVIGNDVWIGTRATVLPGAQIGDGVIVGAGAVVGGVVPNYTIVAGNPAKPIRKRFDDATIVRLKDIAWWDWPIETIMEHEDAICGADLDALERAVVSVR